MKIVIVNSQVPFVQGGAEYHATNLAKELKKRNHEVETVNIPFKWYPPNIILDHILAVRLLDITETCGEKIDLVIGLKFPAYYIKHPNKVLWILHQHRTAYDLWNTQYGDIPHNEFGKKIRETIIKADNLYLPEAKRIFTNSKNVANRLKKFNNIEGKPLYHPPPNAEMFYCSGYEEYFLYPSRFSILKRQELAILAMKYVKSNVKLLIAGRPDSQEYVKKYQSLIEENNLEDKVKLLINISEEEKIKLYSKALGVIFTPYDEDYGYVTLEAMLSKKPVITAEDSGGPLEFIENEENGFIVKADPKDIAEKMDILFENKSKAKIMGEKGFEKYKALNISWDYVVESLVS